MGGVRQGYWICKLCGVVRSAESKTLKEHMHLCHRDSNGNFICKGTFPCCLKTQFTDYMKFHPHVHAVHGKDQFECEKCRHTFKSRVGLSRHEKAVHQSCWLVPCLSCGLEYPKPDFLSHANKYHRDGESSYVCGAKRRAECSEKFKTSSMLFEHLKTKCTKEVKSAWTCQLCNTSFPPSKLRKVHMHSCHTNSEGRFTCDGKLDCCLKNPQFNNYKKFSDHVRRAHEIKNPATSTKEPPTLIRCLSCSVEYVDRNFWKHAKAYHRDEDGFFVCGAGRRAACSAKWKTTSQLLKHVKHRCLKKDTKVWKCNLCNVRFTSPKLKKKHVISCHTNSRGRFICNGKSQSCPKYQMSQNYEEFAYHVRKAHSFKNPAEKKLMPEKLICFLCNIRFPSPENKTNHMNECHTDSKGQFRCNGNSTTCSKYQMCSDYDKFSGHLRRMHKIESLEEFSDAKSSIKLTQLKNGLGFPQHNESGLEESSELKIQNDSTTCSTCGAVNDNSRNLKRHMSIHAHNPMSVLNLTIKKEIIEMDLVERST